MGQQDIQVATADPPHRPEGQLAQVEDRRE
jgi:hypothetical protein